MGSLGKVLHGLFIWEIKSIPNYSAKIEPPSQLLRSSIHFRWSGGQRNSFQKLMTLFLNSHPYVLLLETAAISVGRQAHHIDQKQILN
jgi:hypothetical protein